jgi:hypothetical protein
MTHASHPLSLNDITQESQVCFRLASEMKDERGVGFRITNTRLENADSETRTAADFSEAELDACLPRLVRVGAGWFQ